MIIKGVVLLAHSCVALAGSTLADNGGGVNSFTMLQVHT